MAPARIKGRMGSTITKFPHPEKHPMNSWRGGMLKAGRQHMHASEDATVSKSAGGPTITICTTNSKEKRDETKRVHDGMTG